MVSGAKTKTTTITMTGLKYVKISRISLRLFLLMATEMASVSDAVMQISKFWVSGYRLGSWAVDFWPLDAQCKTVQGSGFKV